MCGLYSLIDNRIKLQRTMHYTVQWSVKDSKNLKRIRSLFPNESKLLHSCITHHEELTDVQIFFLTITNQSYR